MPFSEKNPFLVFPFRDIIKDKFFYLTIMKCFYAYYNSMKTLDKNESRNSSKMVFFVAIDDDS